MKFIPKAPRKLVHGDKYVGGDSEAGTLLSAGDNWFFYWDSKLHSKLFPADLALNKITQLRKLDEPKAPALKIAFIGPMRSGKSEAARYLAETYDFEKVSFGDHLRYCVETVWGVNETGVKPRAQLQQLGQLARQFDPDVWVKPLAAKVFQLTAGNANRERQVSVVIDDLRQPNEYEWCKANGFTIVRVISSPEAQKERIEALGETYNPAHLAHETEQHHANFAPDHLLINVTGTSLDQLHAQLDALIERLAHEYYESAKERE
ncbi:AAA family ATPase [Exiguobacterium sp. KRL4]|uniref:AAA family ATPase n=1 Tax=Exiguobacterium sp. KRL4 TaxID=1914536 RepID=UPI0009F1E9FC|nr:AAA family ATPase [Exiguobacterium sp. KRL4]